MGRSFLKRNLKWSSILLALFLCEPVLGLCLRKNVREKIQCFKIPDEPPIMGKTHCMVPSGRVNTIKSACEQGSCIVQSPQGLDVCMFQFGVFGTKDSKSFYCDSETLCLLQKCDSENGRCVGEYACAIYNVDNEDAGIEFCDIGTTTTSTTTTPTTTTTTAKNRTNPALTSHDSENNQIDAGKGSAEEVSNRQMFIIIGNVLLFAILIFVVGCIACRKLRRKRKQAKFVVPKKPLGDSSSSSLSRSTPNVTEKSFHETNQKKIESTRDGISENSKAAEQANATLGERDVESQEMTTFENSAVTFPTACQLVSEYQMPAVGIKASKMGNSQYASPDGNTVSTIATVTPRNGKNPKKGKQKNKPTKREKPKRV